MSNNTNPSINPSLHQRLMDHGEDHMRLDNKLDNMIQTNENTIGLGDQALATLKIQGTKLDAVNQKLEEIGINARRVDSKTQNMRNRQFYMNLLLYFVALALLISILIILGIKIAKKLN